MPPMPLRLEVQTLKHWQGSPRLLQTLLSPGLLPRLLWELLERWESLIIGHGPWPKSFQTRLTSYDSKLFGPVQTSSAAFCWGSKAVRGAGPTNERKTHKVVQMNQTATVLQKWRHPNNTWCNLHNAQHFQHAILYTPNQHHVQVFDLTNSLQTTAE